MINFIHENQLKSNLKKYGFKSTDQEVNASVNVLQQKVVGDLLNQVKKAQRKVQNGGRVAFPIDYFGGQTNNLSSVGPAYTNISADAVNIRQALPLHDPSSALGTEKAMQSVMFGGQGKKEKFQVSQTAASKVVKHLMKQEDVTVQDSKEFTRLSKQKFESVMNEVLIKAQKSANADHLSQENIDSILKQKKYKSFKA